MRAKTHGAEQCSETLDDAQHKRQHQGRQDYQQHDGHQSCPTDKHARALADTDSVMLPAGGLPIRKGQEDAKPRISCEDVANTSGNRRKQVEQPSGATKWSNQSLTERQAKGQQIRLNTQVSPGVGQGGQLNPEWVEWLMGWTE